MRCGSTTLWELLGQHEQVFFPSRKELHFFDDRDGDFARGLEWYARHFQAAPVGSLCGETTPSYIYLPEACDRIARHLPDCRLIIILRDPVRRAWSHYWYNCNRGFEPLDFERALDREPRRLGRGDVRTRILYSYVGRGHYLEQLKRYEAAFSRTQLYVLLFDDLIRDPQGTMAAIFTHLGLDVQNESAMTLPTRNQQSHHPRLPRVQAIAKRYEAWGERSLFARAVRRTARTALNLNRRPSLPPMRDVTVERLVEMFRPGNEALAEWMGRPLPWA